MPGNVVLIGVPVNSSGTADGCAGWSVCIYNPDLDPGRSGADDVVGFVTNALR